MKKMKNCKIVERERLTWGGDAGWFLFDMDKRYRLASGEEIFNSPFES